MQTTNKNVSLIVLNYNGKKHLEEYFNSVFNQTLLPDEIIMLDNSSTDDSINYVKNNFPKVKIIKNHFNAGTAEGSNIAFRNSNGRYIIFQSNDLRLDKNCVKTLVEIMEKKPSVGICTSVLVNYYKNKNGQHLIDNAGGIADIFCFGMQNYPEKRLKTIPEIGNIFFSYGGSFIIRRELFEKAGGFDFRYFTLNDDIDLSWRVKLLGYDIIYYKKSVVYHKVSATLGPLFERSMKRYWSERNIIRTMLKNRETKYLLLYFPLYMLLLLMEMLYFLFRKRFSLFVADVKAVLWNIFYLPETIKMRIKIQSIKKKNRIENMLHHTSFKLKLFHSFKKTI